MLRSVMEESFPTVEELAPLAERLAEAVGARMVVLFGSFARGEGGPNSDVDLLYVLPDHADLLAVAPLAELALWPRRWSFDLVPMRESHWRAGRSVLARRVAEEGIVLYAA
ncbi:MAG: nucleotidyltransferase domain-containing protein [Actinomycetota bacterium]